MFLADNRRQAKVCEASERMGSNVGTVLVVTKVFSEQLFAPVRSGDARFDRNLRYGESPEKNIGCENTLFRK